MVSDNGGCWVNWSPVIEGVVRLSVDPASRLVVVVVEMLITRSGQVNNTVLTRLPYWAAS